VNARGADVWVDSHCHVYDTRMDGGPDGAIAAAHEAGVGMMIAVGCDRDSSLAAVEIAERHAGVHPTVGLHPHDAKHGIDTIVDLLDHPAVIGVGEAGLDYYYDHSPRDVQRDVFAAQVRIAHERDLTLVIHTRDAWSDTFDVLDAEGTPRHTVFHCFTGGPGEATQCLERGAFISFSGIVTFPSAPEVQEAARLCPLDRMLIETDSPYLAPVPYRGKRNQPAYVTHVGTFIADLRDEPVDVVRRATAESALLAFHRLRP
jgi:TatD DNase family protein